MNLRAVDLLPALLAAAILFVGSASDPASSRTSDQPSTQLTVTPVR
jgi:hypothetical protein